MSKSTEPYLVTITAPNPAYTGESAGIHFHAGQAIVLSTNTAALEFFERQHYGIDRGVHNADEPDLSIDEQEAATIVAEPASADMTHKELDDLAESRGVDLSGVKGKDEKAAAINAAAIAAQPVAEQAHAGDGPLGPVHNQGRDGADPSLIGAPLPVPDKGI